MARDNALGIDKGARKPLAGCGNSGEKVLKGRRVEVL
jgi:hypothetical protein